MESVIGLCFSALPSPSVRIMPSGFHAARAAKPHLIKLTCSSFSVPKLETRSLSLRYNSSLSLSGNSASRRPLDSIIGPVCCTADSSPSKQSKSDEKRQQEQQLRDLVQWLLQSQPLDLADRLKALDKEYFSLSNKIIDIVKVLKDSENYNLALKLLKVSEQIFIEKEDSLGTFRFKIMEILYSQGKYQEAFDYWIRLCEMKAPQTRRKLIIYRHSGHEINEHRRRRRRRRWRPSKSLQRTRRPSTPSPRMWRRRQKQMWKRRQRLRQRQRQRRRRRRRWR